MLVAVFMAVTFWVMCTNCRYIKNKYGTSILVKCGHCPACLQEKAINRANRIRNTYNNDDFVPLFVTLTYNNHSVPYVNYYDLFDSNKFLNSRCNIYRDSESFYVRNDSSYNFSLKTTYNRVVLKSVELPHDNSTYKNDRFVSLHGINDFDKIGVCYYPDIQNFFKRLNIYLYRHYDYVQCFKSFQCSEYGPTSMRPHFHALIFVKKEVFNFERWKNAICACWPFSDLRKLSRSIEIAKNVSSYVASYVNCSNTLPLLFQKCSEFRPKHSYSKMFGVSKDIFKLPKVLEMYDRGDLHYDCSSVRNGILVSDSLLLPKYVIGRYFPKFKGYFRLTCDEIAQLCFRPASIFQLTDRLELTEVDAHKIYVMLCNKHTLCSSLGIDIYRFAIAYAGIYTLRSSQAYKDSLLQIKDTKDFFEYYDNIEDLYNGNIGNSSLWDIMPDDLDYNVNFNTFSSRLVDTANLTECYNSSNKDKKIRNFILSQNNYL